MVDLETTALSNAPFARRRTEKNDRDLRALLVSHTWAYGPDNKEPRLGRTRFLENGLIGDYKHEKERRWAVRANILTFMTDIGLPTSHFILLFGGAKPVLLGKSVEDPKIRYFLNFPESLVNVGPAKED